MDSEETMSISADTVRTLHYIPPTHTLEPSDQTVIAHQVTPNTSVSTPPSPQHTLGYSATSTVLVLSMPSPPSSPAIGSPNSFDYRSVSPSPSESSLPESVSSSFFFSSSGAGSPGHGGLSSLPLSSEEHESGHAQENEIQRPQRHRSRPPSLGGPSPLSLLIPSIPLPHSLRHPTPFGQTLGSLRILVLRSGSSPNLTSILLEDNEDIVDVGEWEAWPGAGAEAEFADLGKVVKASTDWKRRLAQRSYNARFSGGESENAEESLFEFEPSRNVEIVELERDVDPTELAAQLKSISEPFHALNNVLHPDTEPSGVVKNMLAAPNSGFWTAMVVLFDDEPTTQDIETIRLLSTYVPLVVLPSRVSSHFKGNPRLSAFTPRTAVALRAGLFRSPERLAMLRREAVDRFLWWRAVQKWGTMDDGIKRERIGASRRLVERRGRVGGSVEDDDLDDEEEEDARWDASREAAAGGVWKRRRRRRGTTISANRARPLDVPQYHSIDPLHLPSLIVLSLSLFAPLKERVGSVLASAVESLKERRVQAALIGGFCVGVGVGLWVGGW